MKKFRTLIVTFVGLFGATGGALKTADTTNNVEYEIYPTVQSITYGDKNSTISGKYNIVYESKIDSYTKNKAIEVLSRKNVKASIGDDISTEKGNLLLGVYSSKEKVDSYITEDVSYISEKIDSYYLSIKDNNIVILGKDSDSVYYGLSTLDLIFQQTQDEVRELEIKDYSSSYYRGFIEGYYGIPWTSEERKELMRFGSKFKSNIYIYAPKDDAYHSSCWRDLYAENDLEILKEQIEVGRETKTKLAWALHPFMSNKITADNYDASLQIVEKKFNQLYEAGVRQFVISADDVEVTGGLLEDGSLHNKLLNDVATFLKAKNDCNDLVFVPSAYCYQAEQRLKVDLNKYYASLMKDLDDSIHIMWTGDDVCSSMESGRFTEFTNLTNKKPFFWLNWPVNDYSTDHLLMGKGEVLNINYTDDTVPFEGMVTNQMQQAEPSKLSIFAICDYTWNPNKFNVDKSYNDSFKYVEEKEYESLKAISSHLTNANLYEGKYFEEAKDLKELITEYETTNDATKLVEYFTKFTASIESFKANAKNTKLKDSMLPWIEALEDASNAMINYLTIMKDFDNLSNDQLKTMLDNGNSYEEKSKLHKEPVLNVITYNIDYKYADYGVSVLKPFMNKVKQIVNDKVKLALGLPTGIVYEGFDSIYSGSVDNIFDGDESTYCWFGSVPSEDAYIRIDLEEVKEIHDIKILYGNANGATDYMVGKVYVSRDAKNYNYVGLSDSASVLLDLRDNPVNARYIMIKNSSTETWVSIKEVSYNTLSLDQITVTADGFVMADAAHADFNLMLDNDLSTYVWFDWHCTVGAYVCLDLRQVKEIKKISFYQNTTEHPGDLFENCTFYISEDGVNYTKVGDDNYLSQEEIIINLDNVRARYVKVESNVVNNSGVTIREFIVE